MEDISTENSAVVLVRILFFAQAKEQTKTSEATISFSASKAYKPREILESILASFPTLKPLQQCIILAVNQTYLDSESEEEFVFKSIDEIAVIPPISAGN